MFLNRLIYQWAMLSKVALMVVMTFANSKEIQGQGFVNLLNGSPTLHVRRPVWNYDGRPLESSRYLARLLGGPDAKHLQPVGDTIRFRVDGIFTEGTFEVPGVRRGEEATFKLLAWDTRSGATFEEARLRGMSALFKLRLAGPINPPPTLTTMESFHLVPEGKRVPASRPARPEENLIHNGSFEGGGERWEASCGRVADNGAAVGEKYAASCGSLLQGIETEDGTGYQLRFAYRITSEDDSAPDPIEVLWGEEKIAALTEQKPDWLYFAGRVEGTGEQVELRFQSESRFDLDDVRLEPVPARLTVRFDSIEPLPADSTKVLLSLSAVGVKETRQGFSSEAIDVRVEVSENLTEWEPFLDESDCLRFRDRLHLVDDIESWKYYRALLSEAGGPEDEPAP